MLSAHEFAELYDPWPDVCLLLTREGEVLAANRAGRQMLAMPAGAPAARSITELVSDPPGRVRTYLRTCSLNRQPIPGSLLCRRAGGEVVKYRCLGYRLAGQTPEAPAVFLRCSRAQAEGNHFISLNRQLEREQSTQRTLKASLAQLKTILDSLDALVYVADMQTYEVLFVNKYAQDLLGDITGRICWQTIQQGQTGPCSFCTNKYLLTADGQPGGTHVWEFQNTRTGRWFHNHDRVIVWGDGRLVRLEIATDVSTRKAAERELQLDEERAAALLQLAQHSWTTKEQLAAEALEEAVRLTRSPVGYLHFVREDEQTLELVAWSKAVLAGCSAAKVTHYPLGKAGIWADCVRLRRPVIHNDYPNAPERKGYPAGHFSLLRHMSVPIFFQERIVAVVGVGNRELPYDDVDAHQLMLFGEGMWQVFKQREAEIAVRESKERWEQTFNAIDEVVTIHDTEMRIVQANTFAGALFGIAPNDLVGRYCYEVFRGCPEPCPGCPELLGRTDYHPHQATVLHENLGKTFDVSSFPLLSDGVLKGFVHIAKDVTEQRMIEAHLRQVQKMESVGTLAGGIAHDFNNILAPILGYAELALTRVGATDAIVGDLRQIAKAAGRAKELVQQILTFSRRSEHEKKPLQPHLIVKEALKLLRASLPATIEIRQEIPADCGTVMGDPTQVHQIVMNLCTNAYHAMRVSGGILGVKLQRVEVDAEDLKVATMNLAAGNYVMLEISDTGCGMDQATVERIFEPYFTTKPKDEGTGLGLSVVHGIVQSYGGHISVYSVPGQGTTFHVYLPRLAEESVAGEMGEGRPEPLPRGTGRLLVVDDEEEIGRLLHLLLQNLGYEVEVCTQSAEALARFAKEPQSFDLLITDMTMPNMTGFELASRVLALRPGMPIVLCTGFSEIVTREKALALGIREFLMKPVTLKELAHVVQKALAPSP